MQRRIRAVIAGAVMLSGAGASGGQIAGTPSQAPPTIERDYELNFSNDFLGRGGAVDDFRTQQIVLTAWFANGWLALLDHSILTLGDASAAGRLDQLSGSLGYRLLDDTGPGGRNSLTLGAGFRSSGEFAGERIQNGFHRLVGSSVKTLPYVATRRTDATLWLDAERYRVSQPASGNSWMSRWRRGYWIRGNTLLTSDGQLDAGLGVYAVASRNAIDLWLGLRQDWRSGYDRDTVQEATANAEQDLAVVLGARFGALVLETVQQTGNDASYGQLRFVSSGRRAFPQAAAWPRIGLEFGFVLPDIQVQVAARMHSRRLTGGNGDWRRSILLEARFGEPQYGSDPSVFVRSRQLSIGLEWERQLSAAAPWASFYAALAGGWRSEQLLGDNARAGQESATVGRAAIQAGIGLRFNAASLGRDWWYRLQLGVVAWAPLDDALATLGGDAFRIQQRALGLSLGMTFDYR